MDHPEYKPASDQSKADACAWVFKDESTFTKYYYKHPPLLDDQIRCRVIYSALCMSDSLTGRGKWGKRIRPVCTGHEVIGEIEEKGSKVTGFEIGEIVAFGPFRDSCSKCEFCVDGKTNACQNIDFNEKKLYGKYFGGYSTHIQQPTSHAFKLPKGLDLSITAPLMCAGVTVFTPLMDHLKPGMRVGVIGVGGLGHLAIQYAAKMGAEVHGFTSSISKESFIKELGAKEVILWKQSGYHLKLLNSYDMILNTLSVNFKTEEFSLLSKILKPYGKFIQMGVPEHGSKLDINYHDIVGKQIMIIGSLVGGVKHTKAMLEFSAKNDIKCKCEIFEWNDFPKALDKLENGRPLFRCVVHVDPESKKFKK
jgi:D-arabinose 1-dehydrogenase-like Zn-dependent alcohol dehydrogenase